MQTISIFTCTMGRWYYLRELIKSIDYHPELEHFIIFQGVKPDEETLKLIESISNIKCEYLEQNIGIAAAINYINPKLTGDIVIKLDEDAKIISKDAFTHIREINNIFPNLVFSFYPVGLINNPGGVPAISHYVRYSEKLGVFYTFRKVHHVGGFARISPRHITKNWILNNDLIAGISGNEDGQVSNLCNQNGIELAYLECHLVCEHQEATNGQHQRYGQEYFKGRF